MKLPEQYFMDFITAIKPSKKIRNDLKSAHQELSQNLLADQNLSPIIVTTFLQGSYKRHTAVSPDSNSMADVDVVAVTRLDKDRYSPMQAQDCFRSFLDTHYSGKWETQGRSIGISLGTVNLDFVITSAPSEAMQEIVKAFASQEYTGFAEDDFIELKKSFSSSIFTNQNWRAEPLYIPNNDAGIWERTHPIKQTEWTAEKNHCCNGHYINIVRAIKWWRRMWPTASKYPKGYPLEHLVGYCCPDETKTLQQGLFDQFETMLNLLEPYYRVNKKPTLQDHGVPEHDVWGRISLDEFRYIFAALNVAATIAKQAKDAQTPIETTACWRKLFGDDFPSAPDDLGGFFPGGDDQTDPKSGRFA